MRSRHLEHRGATARILLKRKYIFGSQVGHRSSPLLKKYIGSPHSHGQKIIRQGKHQGKDVAIRNGLKSHASLNLGQQISAIAPILPTLLRLHRKITQQRQQCFSSLQGRQIQKPSYFDELPHEKTPTAFR